MNKNIAKLSLFSLLTLSFSLATATVLTACSAQTNQWVKKNADKTLYATNKSNSISRIDIKSVAEKALINDGTMDDYIKSWVDELYKKMYQNFASKSNEYSLKVNETNEINKVNKEVEDLINQRKESDPSNYEFALQTEVLDKNGGTIEAYKQRQLDAWYASEISRIIFENDFSGIVYKKSNDNDKQYKIQGSVTLEQLAKIANEEEANYEFGFAPLSRTRADQNQYKDYAIAKLQEWIFNKWLKEVKPFVVNMVLWKYASSDADKFYLGLTSSAAGDSSSDSSASEEGSSDENSSAEANTSSSSSASGSYTLPLFSHKANDHLSNSTIDKFNSFIKANKNGDNNTNFIPKNYIGTNVKNKLGFKNIAKTFTEDQSTLILIDPSNFNQLVPEFMAAALSLYLEKTQKQMPAAKEMLPSLMVENDNNNQQNDTPFDDITKMFIKYLDNNGHNDNDFKKYATEIDHAALEEIINPNGLYKSLLEKKDNKKLYAIDAFKAKDDHLNEFMFIRNEFGIHAISIDGFRTTTNGATSNNLSTAEEIAKRTKQVLFYRNQLYKMANSTPEMLANSLEFDLKDKIRNYFEANRERLIVELLTESNNSTLINALFGKAESDLVTNAQEQYFKALIDYKKQKVMLDTILNNNNSIKNKKDSYRSNFGLFSNSSIAQNGFASKWVYESSTDGLFNFIKNFYANDNKNNSNGNDFNQLKTALNQAYRQLFDKVKSFVTQLNLTSANATYEKYSQVVFSNNYHMNKVLNNYTENYGSNFTTIFTRKILQQSPSPQVLNIKWKEQEIEFKKGSNWPTNVDVNKLKTSFVRTYLGSKYIDINQSPFTNAYEILAKKIYEPNNSSGQSSSSSNNNKNTVAVNMMDQLLEKKMFYDIKWSTASLLILEEELIKFSFAIDYLLSNNAKEFINQLKSKIEKNTEYVIAWMDNANSKLEKTNIFTTDDLLDPTKRLKVNHNNMFASSYGSLDNLYESEFMQNIDQNGTYGTSEGAHFSYAKGTYDKELLGYLGLVKKGDSKLGPLETYVFPSRYNQNSQQGALYQYGSRENLIAIVNETIIDESLDSLLNEIHTKLGNFDINDILDKGTLEEKKKAFVALLKKNGNSSNQLFPDHLFQRKTKANNNSSQAGPANNGTQYTFAITPNPVKSIEPGKENIVYGGYMTQVSYYDLFYKNFSSTAMSAEADFDHIKTYLGEDIVYNLLIDFARDNALQSRLYDEIASANKFEIFDINVRNALGSKWVNNFEIE